MSQYQCVKEELETAHRVASIVPRGGRDDEQTAAEFGVFGGRQIQRPQGFVRLFEALRESRVAGQLAPLRGVERPENPSAAGASGLRPF